MALSAIGCGCRCCCCCSGCCSLHTTTTACTQTHTYCWSFFNGHQLTLIFCYVNFIILLLSERHTTLKPPHACAHTHTRPTIARMKWRWKMCKAAKRGWRTWAVGCACKYWGAKITRIKLVFSKCTTFPHSGHKNTKKGRKKTQSIKSIYRPYKIASTALRFAAAVVVVAASIPLNSVLFTWF